MWICIPYNSDMSFSRTWEPLLWNTHQEGWGVCLLVSVGGWNPNSVTARQQHLHWLTSCTFSPLWLLCAPLSPLNCPGRHPCTNQMELNSFPHYQYLRNKTCMCGFTESLVVPLFHNPLFLFPICRYRGSEQVSPRRVAMAYGLLWAKGHGDAVGSGETFISSLKNLKWGPCPS